MKCVLYHVYADVVNSGNGNHAAGGAAIVPVALASHYHMTFAWSEPGCWVTGYVNCCHKMVSYVN